MKPITTNSAVEFLVVLLIAASVIAIVAKRFRFPYTVALVVGGLMLSWLRLPHLSPLLPGQRPDWLSPDVILFLFLPALVFEGSLKLQLEELQRDSASLLLLANLGVLVAAFLVGYLVHWSTGLPVAVALLFGAIISATDPISVIAIFRDLRMERRLSVIIEGESLLNDGTAAALFQILLAGVIAGHLALTTGIIQFIFAVLGGAILGIVLGYVATRITGKINDPEVEITLTTIVAYASYLLAYQLHLSGIIATASYIAIGHDSAEVAFAVADAFQGRGLATALLSRLAAAAAARGCEPDFDLTPALRRLLDEGLVVSFSLAPLDSDF